MENEKKRKNQTNNREALSVLILQEIIHGFVLLDKQCPQAATLQVDMATKFAIIVANSKTPIWYFWRSYHDLRPPNRKLKSLSLELPNFLMFHFVRKLYSSCTQATCPTAHAPAYLASDSLRQWGLQHPQEPELQHQQYQHLGGC